MDGVSTNILFLAGPFLNHGRQTRSFSVGNDIDARGLRNLLLSQKNSRMVSVTTSCDKVMHMSHTKKAQPLKPLNCRLKLIKYLIKLISAFHFRI